MNLNELQLIISNHLKWLNCDKEGKRAVLVGADLRGVDWDNVNLRQAQMSGADLSGAHLNGANLIDADLRGVRLAGASLCKASLQAADCGQSVMSGCLFAGAELVGCNLTECCLEGCDFTGANLERAFLTNAKTDGARGLTIGQTASIWHPIATAPKDGTKILLACRDQNHSPLPFVEIGFFYANRWTQWENRRGVMPTHWMPFPPIPTT